MDKGLKAKSLLTTRAEIEKNLESIKWYLWHGNVFDVLQKFDSLEFDRECVEDVPLEQRKLYKAISEFNGYIQANASFIPNYGIDTEMEKGYQRLLLK